MWRALLIRGTVSFLERLQTGGYGFRRSRVLRFVGHGVYGTDDVRGLRL